MWIVKKCETGHRQCVSVRQSVRQSLHPIRYIFHAVSQATGSLSLSPLSLSCSVNHCIWLGYWHPFLMLLADNKEPNTKLSFLSLLLLLLGSLLCPDNNNNNNNLSTITTTATTVAIIADNQSLHVFHFVFLQSFLAFIFVFLIMPQLDWTNQSV